MILLSPDAVLDVELLRSFLAVKSPGSTRRALSAVWAAIDARELGMAEKATEFLERGADIYVRE